MVDPIRRGPQQARSRERVQRIMAAAAELIAQYGIEQVRMTEVAEMAGVPIGSVYQFFPDKLAIVRALGEQVMDASYEHVVAAYASVSSPEDFLTCTDGLIRVFYESQRDDAVTQAIVLAMHTDRDLHKLDLADSRRHGEAAYSAGSPFVAPSRRREFRRACLISMHLVGPVVHLAIDSGRREGDAIVRVFRSQVAAECHRFFGESSR